MLHSPTTTVSQQSFTGVIDNGNDREQAIAGGGLREKKDIYARFDLIPAEAMHRLGVHYAAGAKKYEARNWERGLSYVRTFNSMMGHAFKWMRCKALGVTPEEDHLAAVAWGAFALMTFESRIAAVKLRYPGDVIPEEADDIDAVVKQ